MKHLARHFHILFATGFYSGLSPVMPGTCGTAVGLILFVLLSGYSQFHPLLTALFIILGTVSSDYVEKKVFKVKDHQSVVIDEIAGYWITMTAFSFDGSLQSWITALTGFVLFRVFDIVKPFPIRASQKLKGGLGIMIDDIIAGVFANLALRLLINLNIIH